MDEKIEITINKYLRNEEKLYEDWYNLLNNPDGDPDIIPVALLPVEEIKNIFIKWFDMNKNKIKDHICEQWIHLFKQDIVTAILIAQLADFLAFVEFTHSVNLLSSSTILVTKGYLENLCS